MVSKFHTAALWQHLTVTKARVLVIAAPVRAKYQNIYIRRLMCVLVPLLFLKSTWSESAAASREWRYTGLFNGPIASEIPTIPVRFRWFSQMPYANEAKCLI